MKGSIPTTAEAQRLGVARQYYDGEGVVAERICHSSHAERFKSFPAELKALYIGVSFLI